MLRLVCSTTLFMHGYIVEPLGPVHLFHDLVEHQPEMEDNHMTLPILYPYTATWKCLEDKRLAWTCAHSEREADTP